jgi:hypothetical protein
MRSMAMASIVLREGEKKKRDVRYMQSSKKAKAI